MARRSSYSASRGGDPYGNAGGWGYPDSHSGGTYRDGTYGNGTQPGYGNGGYANGSGGYHGSGYGAQGAYAASPQDAASYSRDAYARGGRGGRGRGPRGSGRRGGSRAGRVVKWVLGVIAAIILICIIAVFAYASAFDSRTHANLSSPDTIEDVLTPAEDENSEPFYVLLLGSDWRENSGTSDKEEMSGDNQRADVIILARLDPAKEQVTLVSVPRDTRWYYNGTTYKINEAYNIGGAALETQAVSELVGVSITHTVEMHFSGLEELVDALGGVTVDVPQTIEYEDALTGEKVTVEAGEQVLNGQEAQIFARVRKSYDTDNQDETRQGNVRTLVLAIMDAIRDKSPLEYPALGLSIADCLGTDMGFFDFLGIAANFLGGDMTLYSGTGPAAGEVDESAGGLWLCYENPEGWQAVMDVVDSGGDPSTVDADSYLAAQDASTDDGSLYDAYGNYIGDGSLYDEYGNYIGDGSAYDEYGNYIGSDYGY